MNTDEIEAKGQEIIDLIVEEGLVDAPQERLMVWSGGAPYIIGKFIINDKELKR